jgi:WD40 repeat protein
MTVQTWDTSEWSLTDTLQGPHGNGCMPWVITSALGGIKEWALPVFSPNRELQAWIIDTGAVEVWDGHQKVAGIPAASQCRVSVTSPSACASSVTFTADGTRILIGSWDGNVQTWNFTTGTRTTLGKMRCCVRSVGAGVDATDGTELFAAGLQDHTAHVWRNGVEIPPLMQTSIVYSLAFSPNGTQLASGSGDDGLQNLDAVIWPLLRGQAGWRAHHNGLVYALAYSPDGSILATGAGDGKIQLWDSKSGRSLGQPLSVPKPATSLTFSPDGTLLAADSGDGFVRVWTVP